MRLTGSWSLLDQVLRTPGNNLHEVETAQGQRFLVSMPSKYRKNIWIKRGERGSPVGDNCFLGAWFPPLQAGFIVSFLLSYLQATFSLLTRLKREKK